MSSSVVHLKDESLKLYKRYLAYLEVVRDELLDWGGDTTKLDKTTTLLLSEFSYCQLHFYKYEKAEESLSEAKKLANLKIELCFCKHLLSISTRFCPMTNIERRSFDH